jgi:hypothetical protein
MYNHCCRCSRKGQQKTEMGARVKDVPSENGTTLVPILMRAIFSPEAEVILVEILSCDVHQPFRTSSVGTLRSEVSRITLGFQLLAF